jgi:serine/threonine-protein kinase
VTDPLFDRLGPALAGRYTITRELGRGGMATVFLAHDVRHDRPVALKVVRPEVAAALGAERFLREIKVTARLNHPHILPLLDSGEAGGCLYYVMPYVEGESLRERLDREQQLPVDDALRITGEVADALAYAHSRDVLHRDVKPENILIAGGHALVADFGIARAITTAGPERLTEAGIAIGTPAYMSPEQATGSERLDGRSDIYSLGCVLYEMLAGEPPFAGPTAQAVIAKRLADAAPGVRRVRPAVPTGVERALLTALARVPADRFATCAAFVAALAARADVPPSQPSVAVLPFVNLSADPENEFFADGITEDVIAHLSRIRTMQVISRTSVMPFKERQASLREIGSKLGVATLLEGSVRRAGDRVRIVAQLIDAETDRHLWAETYDRQLTDVFAIQTDVALHIAAALRAELSPDETRRLEREPTRDLEAYQLYLRGRQCYLRFTPEGMRQSIGYFEQAIARDPAYALASVGIAGAYVELGETGSLEPKRAHQAGREAVARALALDDGLGEAHCLLGQIKVISEFDWAGAEREFRLAMDRCPSSADTYDFYGRLCGALGRYDEAIALQRRAHELDPLAHRSDLANALLRAGRLDEALEAARNGVDLDPLYDRAHATLGWALLLTGSPELGVAELERAVSLTPASTVWLAQLGQVYAMTGRPERARKILRQMEERSHHGYVAPYHLAYVYTGLGELDAAMDWLERAYEERSGAVYGIKGSFLFAPLRGHPRFTALLKKMHLDSPPPRSPSRASPPGSPNRPP